jgi:hypothetical protein
LAASPALARAGGIANFIATMMDIIGLPARAAPIGTI